MTPSRIRRCLAWLDAARTPRVYGRVDFILIVIKSKMHTSQAPLAAGGCRCHLPRERLRAIAIPCDVPRWGRRDWLGGLFSVCTEAGLLRSQPPFPAWS